MRISVQGIGVVGAFGTGVDDMQRALCSGTINRSSIHLANCGKPLDIPAMRADTSKLKDFVQSKLLRRIDNFSRLGLLGAYLALEDAGVLEDGKQDRLAVVIASGYGATGITFAFLDSFINDGDICASPTYFANSVHNSAAANISIMLGATGPNSTISQLFLSVPSALQTAKLWLAEDRVDRVLFGAVEELSELIGYAWYRQRGATAEPAVTPLLTRRESAIPGEGAAFMLLSKKEETKKGYCFLDEVITGRHLKPESFNLDGDLLVLGADGRMEKAGEYATLAGNSHISCFTPFYGTMPAGPAFDIAAAALMLKEGKSFATPSANISDCQATVALSGEPLKTSAVSCLSLSDDDSFGLVKLSKL